MNYNNVKFEYESLDNKSYLVASLSENAQIEDYPLNVLLINDIPNVIKARKMLKDNTVRLYYNVTSRLSLAEAVKMQKITKSGFINIIRGGIRAYKEIADYPLPSRGLLLDEEYIFVKTGSFEPDFVYLPVYSDDVDIDAFRDFLLRLIMINAVEFTDDGFIKEMLELLNSPGLDFTKLENKTKAGKPKFGKGPVIVEPKLPEPSQPEFEQVDNVEVKKGVKIHIPNSDKSGGKTDARKNKSNKKSDKPKTKMGIDLSGDKIKFTVATAVVVIGIILAIASGIIKDPDTGAIDLSLLGGVFLVGAVVEFVIYREIFVNKKDQKDKKPKSGKKQKADNKKNKKKSLPELPKKKSVIIPGKSDNPNEDIQESIREPEKSPVHEAEPASNKLYTPPVNAFSKADSFYDEEDIGDTVIMQQDSVTEGYLEYYENGIMTKIIISCEGIIVGSLKSQVNFAVKSKKVSKIHAKFIVRDDRYYVIDYNSTNGTFINDGKERIAGNMEKEIENGDRIRLGDCEFTLRC